MSEPILTIRICTGHDKAYTAFITVDDPDVDPRTLAPVIIDLACQLAMGLVEINAPVLQMVNDPDPPRDPA